MSDEFLQASSLAGHRDYISYCKSGTTPGVFNTLLHIPDTVNMPVLHRTLSKLIY